MSRFRVVTFVNDEPLYAEMRASFEAAGFDTFTVLRAGDPYATLTELGSGADEFVVLCHQDIRLDQGHDARDLERVLDDLTRRDPRWALAGNAGGTPGLTLLRHVADPHGATWHDELPRRVTTLDENFVVLRVARRPRCSPELSGFHLYGSDACLNAAKDGSTAYAVDFRLTHLSAGGTAGFEQALARFTEHWRRRFVLRFVRTPSRLLGLSRVPLVSRIVSSRRVVLWIKIFVERGLPGREEPEDQ